MVAPQKWKEPVLTDTCHGIGEGASSPPTILSALVMKDGISAKGDKLYFVNQKLKIVIVLVFFKSYHTLQMEEIGLLELQWLLELL